MCREGTQTDDFHLASRRALQGCMRWQRHASCTLIHVSMSAPLACTITLPLDVQDFMFLALEAFYRSRGAAAYRLKRIPLLASPDVFSEQFACRRLASLPADTEDTQAERPPFQFDSLDGFRL